MNLLYRVLIRNSHSISNSGLLHQLNLKSVEKVKSKRNSLNDLLVSMPKDPVHIPGLKSGRMAKKEVNSKFPAGFIRLEILGNGAKGSPASLYLFTDQTRYLFNCGEGTQRLAHEHKMKLAKLEHIFITDAVWNRIGGIPGAALTIQDIGVPSITLHGPAGLENLFEGTRRFVILKDMKIQVADPNLGFFEDHVMRIDYVTLLPQKVPSGIVIGNGEGNDASVTPEEVDETDYYASINGCKRNLEIQGHSSIVKKLKVDSTGPSHHAFCYICTPKPKAGVLLIQKCVDYGVPAGPLLGKLKNGEDVTLPNGNIVKSSDVRGPDAAATVFIVVDCPTEDYLDALLSNEQLAKYQRDDLPEDDCVHVVIHFTPKEVFAHTSYDTWMKKFRSTTRHILINELCQDQGNEAAYRAQFKLNLVDGELFPLLKNNKSQGKHGGLLAEPEPQSPLLYGAALLRYNLRPDLGPDMSAAVNINGEEFVKEVTDLPDFASSLEKFKSDLSQDSVNHKSSPEEYPELIFLGTGSCIPNKTRNTSAILLRISPSSSMLLDCGEGTYGQLVRFFGDNVESLLVELNAIYISHLHADHHLGLFNLLQRRHEAFQKEGIPFRPVFLVCPHQIESWLHLYHKKFQPIRHLYEIVPNVTIFHPEASIDPVLESLFYNTTGLNKIQTVPVRHCPNAYGVSVTGPSGWKVTYSGDTMPCDALVNIGKDCDLLIHEATMEDELKDEAVIKMHSTVSEAIEMGRKMNAKFTMLTHFSQRYAKVPKINGELEGTVGIAFDNMTLRLSDLWKVPLMYPVFKTMFADHYEDMETKTAKKIRKKERGLL